MEWYINDLSLNGQFRDPISFRSSLEPLLKLRHQNPLLNERLFCSRMLQVCSVTGTLNFQKAILATRDNNYIGLVLGWVSKYGPFWDDNRQLIKDDYFEYGKTDVTNGGLGEAARKKLSGIIASSYSFPFSKFEKSPLNVQHGSVAIEYVDIDNLWTVEQLENALKSCLVLNCWEDVQKEAKRRFNQLIIAADSFTELLTVPFSSVVKKRIFVLLDILNKIAIETNIAGKLSQAGEELLRNNFSGWCTQGTPLFKPESDDNQNHFQKQLTFRDPADQSKSLFCHWHGKIQTPQIRIHFEWPIPKGQREIKVVYIGPKITKK